MVEANGLTYTHPGHHTLTFPTINIQKGESCLVLGESGSGKTTLLHILGGLTKAQKGTVKINDVDISSLNDKQLDKFRGINMGFIFQQPHLIKALTVEENLLIAQYLAGVKQDKKRIREVLDELGLGNKRNARVNQLSHGQALRIVIARSILNHPEIVLADEPTASLDDVNAEKVIELLQDVVHKNNSSLLITTHDKRIKDRFSQSIILD